jgi:hypothetical protein
VRPDDDVRLSPWSRNALPFQPFLTDRRTCRTPRAIRVNPLRGQHLESRGTRLRPEQLTPHVDLQVGASSWTKSV